MRIILPSLIAAASMVVSQAQTTWTPYTFVTFAGGLEAGSADGPAETARFKQIHGIAVDGAGAIYVADTGNHTIRKITPDGMVSTVAGLAGAIGSADGNGSSARFFDPYGVAVDAAQNLYVVDNGNETIRRISPDGEVSTLAGSPGEFGAVDGTGNEAWFWFATQVAVAGDGTLLVTDANNCVVRRVTPGGVVTTFAGQLNGFATHRGSTDGIGPAARFWSPYGVAVDATGVAFVSDNYNHTIRKITPDATVSTFAGSAGASGYADGAGSTARFRLPQGLAVDKGGYVFVPEFTGQMVRRVSPSGEVVTLAGLSETAGVADGTGAAARFQGPIAAAVDGAGNLYVAEYWSHRIRKGWQAVAPVLGGRPLTMADGAVQLTVSGAPGSHYVVQASTDMVDWLPLAACTSTGVTVTVNVPGPSDVAFRFYRAVLE